MDAPDEAGDAPPGPSTGSETKEIVLTRRPGYGTKGVRTQVFVNFFPVNFTPPKEDVVQYQVDYKRGDKELEMKREGRQTFKLLMEQHSDVFGGRPLAFDGEHTLYSIGRLFQETEREFPICTWPSRRRAEDPPPAQRPRTEPTPMMVSLKETGNRIQLGDILHYLRKDPNEARSESEEAKMRDNLRVLDVALRHMADEKFIGIKDSIFFPRSAPQPARILPLGGGLEAWSGYKCVLRPVNDRIALNLDVVTAAMMQPMPVLDFMCQVFMWRGGPPLQLQDRDRVKLKRLLKNVKVRCMHLEGGRNETKKVFDLTTEGAADATFKMRDGTDLTVAQHFHNRNTPLRFPNLPCIDVGRRGRPTWWPLEVCEIVDAQTYIRKLSPEQINALSRGRLDPNSRKDAIQRSINATEMPTQELLNAFGVFVGPDMMKINARLLPAPELVFGNDKMEQPRVGQWNMNDKTVIGRSSVDVWAFVCPSPAIARLEECRHIAEKLGECCARKGVMLNPAGLTVRVLEDPAQDPAKRIDKAVAMLEEVLPGPPGLVVWLLDRRKTSEFYAPIKRKFETELGITTQCIVKDPRKELNDQYYTNVALKINIKLPLKKAPDAPFNNVNWVLKDLHPKAPQNVWRIMQEKPTMILGMDVGHGSPGGHSPSIAAVVGSLDQPAARYAVRVRTQPRGAERIEGLYEPDKPGKGMICELINQFGMANKCPPGRLIVFRDGVSESQFAGVGGLEIAAIKEGCRAAGILNNADGYMPEITYIVAQKRNNTRIFPLQTRGHKPADQNPVPGTIIDTEICHPFFFDFYLNSHQGILGSSRPVHYHVLQDESAFSTDEIQWLTHSLCYSYMRCTRAVSTVAPVFYADLAATHCRVYLDRDGDDDSASDSTAGRATRRISPVEELRPVHPDIRDTMFFC